MSREKQDVAFIPYFIAEGMADRQALTIKRLWILCILLIVLLVGSNALWLWYESQWQVVETEITQESESGHNNYIGGDGDINNGKTDSKNTKQS